MLRKITTHPKKKGAAFRHAPKSKARGANDLAQQPRPAHLLMKAINAPSTLTPSDVVALQQTAGNRAVRGILRGRSGENDNSPVQRNENRTGLPDGLKSGIEKLTGISMDDVTVHYNSTRPARVRALAFTQGTDIYVRPAEEKHLPHEAWHVVQQKQGKVKPTRQSNGKAINDDRRLEREADVMGEKATRLGLGEAKRRGSGSIKDATNLTSIAIAKPNLGAHGGVTVAQLRNAGQVPDANTGITRSHYLTDHGHTDAEIRAAIIAGWANRRNRGGRLSVSWGAGAPSGVIFYDNGNSFTIIHAQSGANIRAQRRLRAAAYAARRAAGLGSASASWR